jgi:hypothetical protein
VPSFEHFILNRDIPREINQGSQNEAKNPNIILNQRFYEDYNPLEIKIRIIAAYTEVFVFCERNESARLCSKSDRFDFFVRPYGYFPIFPKKYTRLQISKNANP